MCFYTLGIFYSLKCTYAARERKWCMLALGYLLLKGQSACFLVDAITWGGFGIKLPAKYNGGLTIINPTFDPDSDLPSWNKKG